MINFDKLVEMHLTKEQKAKQIGRYYPSEIGSCMRKTWYSYKYPQQVSMDLLKIFEAGNMVHDFVVRVFKSEKNKNVELVKEEMPFKFEGDGFIISGRIDDLVLLKENGKQVLVEVKSAKTIKGMEKAKLSNELQLILYMHILNIPDGVLLYVDKTNLQSKVFVIPYDKKRGEQIIERFKQLDVSLKSNLLPEAEGKQIEDLNWMCSFCEYVGKCDKNES